MRETGYPIETEGRGSRIPPARRSELPANIGLTNQDPEIPLNDIVREVRAWDPGPVVSNSFGFGGHNTVVVIGPPN